MFMFSFKGHTHNTHVHKDAQIMQTHPPNPPTHTLMHTLTHHIVVQYVSKHWARGKRRRSWEGEGNK